MRRFKSVSFAQTLVAVGLMVATSGCLNADLALDGPNGCIVDSDCNASLCIVGVCVDPQAENIADVDIEVRPPEESGWLPQQVFGVTPGANTRLVFQLRPSATFSGSVMTAEGGPMAARVLAIPDAGIVGRTLVRTVDTDPVTGAFQLTVVAQEQYRVVVSPVDTSIATFELTQAYTAGPLAGEVELGDVRMPAEEDLLQIAGRVVAGEGIGALGIPSLEVRVFDGQRRVSSVGVTDQNGQFSVRLSAGQSSGRTLSVEVRPSEDNALFPTVVIDDLQFEADTVLPTIELGAAVTSPVPVAGRVIGPDFAPVERATIYASAQLGPGTLDVVTTTDEQGRYALDLPPGSWTISARSPSTNAVAGLLLRRVVEVDGPQPSLDLVVAPRVLATGRITNAADRGIAEATVRLIRLSAPGGGAEANAELGWAFLATTDVEGAFSASLDPGRYRVTVSPPQKSGEPDYTRLVDVFTEPPALDIQLPPPAHLAGEMLAPSGAAVGAYGQIRVFTPFVAEGGESLQLGSSETADDGTFGVVLPDLLWTGQPDGLEPEPDPPSE